MRNDINLMEKILNFVSMKKIFYVMNSHIDQISSELWYTSLLFLIIEGPLKLFINIDVAATEYRGDGFRV